MTIQTGRTASGAPVTSREGTTAVAELPPRLLAAVRTGDSRAVAELLALGADADQRDPATGLTALMLAAGRADAATVRVLVEAGADVVTADLNAGATALHKACQGGSVEVARLLLEAGAFVDAVATTTGHTPLMDALWFKWPDLAGFLLDHGAGLNLHTHYGFSLQEHFAYELAVNTLGKDRLLRAEALLEARRKADADAADGQELMAAVIADDVDRVRALIAAGAELEARFPHVNGFNDGHTPLHVACRDGHEAIVAELLAAGADVNAVEPVFGAVPLHKAVYNGHAAITRMLAGTPAIRLDVQGFTNGYTALHDALWHGYVECAEVLVDAGAALDGRGHDGKTPLDIARETLGPDHRLTVRLGGAPATG